MSARFSPRAKLRPNDGCVLMYVVSPTDLPTLAAEARSRKRRGASGVRYSSAVAPVNSSDVAKRKRCAAPARRRRSAPSRFRRCGLGQNLTFSAVSRIMQCFKDEPAQRG